MADSRSLGSGFQRLLTRKLLLKPAESAAIYNPTEGHFSRLQRLVRLFFGKGNIHTIA
jgi:hypothetical protein